MPAIWAILKKRFRFPRRTTDVFTIGGKRTTFSKPSVLRETDRVEGRNGRTLFVYADRYRDGGEVKGEKAPEIALVRTEGKIKKVKKRTKTYWSKEKGRFQFNPIDVSTKPPLRLKTPTRKRRFLKYESTDS